MIRVPVVHGCTYLQRLGGVQSLLRRHRQIDPMRGLVPHSVIYFESGPFPATTPPATTVGLGLRGWNSGRTLRRRLARWPLPDSNQGPVWVYHDVWGLRTVADLDRAGRRIGVLHSHWEGLEDLLPHLDGLVDGLLCVSDTLVKLAEERMPTLATGRIRWLPYPVDPPAGLPSLRPATHQELVVGYCGRIQRSQKRVERLPVLARELRSLGVRHRWEILGDGPERRWLSAAFANADVPVRFHGTQGGAEYWQTLGAWDAMVFTSDFEGLPIALLEGLSQGVLPVFPDVEGGGRNYTHQVAGELTYRAGDPEAASRCIQWLSSLPAETRQELRERAKALVEPHRHDAYGQVFSDFILQMCSSPRLSAHGDRARRAHPGEHAPFSILGRLSPSHTLRRGYM